MPLEVGYKKKAKKKSFGKKKNSKLVKEVKSIVHKTMMKDSGSINWIDVIGTGITLNTTPTYLYPNMTLGLGANTGRISQKVFITKLHIRYLALASTGVLVAADLYNNIRVVITRSKGESGSSSSSPNFAVTSYYQLLDTQQSGVVMYDKTHFLNQRATGYTSTGITTSPQGEWTDVTIPWNHAVEFTNASATGDVDGLPQIALISDSTAVPNPSITYHFRFYCHQVV